MLMEQEWTSRVAHNIKYVDGWVFQCLDIRVNILWLHQWYRPLCPLSFSLSCWAPLQASCAGLTCGQIRNLNEGKPRNPRRWLHSGGVLSSWSGLVGNDHASVFTSFRHLSVSFPGRLPFPEIPGILCLRSLRAHDSWLITSPVASFHFSHVSSLAWTSEDSSLCVLLTPSCPFPTVWRAPLTFQIPCWNPNHSPNTSSLDLQVTCQLVTFVLGSSAVLCWHSSLARSTSKPCLCRHLHLQHCVPCQFFTHEPMPARLWNPGWESSASFLMNSLGL